jgi:DNA-binding NtrC family response regulator
MKSLLLVDDSAFFREAMTMVLEAEGYAVKSVVDVEQALRAIARCHFDVIISDYEMPQKNGLDFLRLLRIQHVDTPFVMVSASDDVCVEAEALLLGVVGFITKPFNKVDLLRTVSRALAVGANGDWQYPEINIDDRNDQAA